MQAQARSADSSAFTSETQTSETRIFRNIYKNFFVIFLGIYSENLILKYAHDFRETLTSYIRLTRKRFASFLRINYATWPGGLALGFSL